MGDQIPADLLRADLTIEYPFNRTTGPVIGAFYSGLREQRFIGIRGADGRVVCPPVEYDPISGEPLTELVPVGSEGEVVSWSWVPAPRANETLSEPHALALVRLDGADTAMLAPVAAPSADAIRTGSRVTARWADERNGELTDLECFELAEDAS